MQMCLFETFQLEQKKHGDMVKAKLTMTINVQGDYKTFGRLMVESHNSLRDDFEVLYSSASSIISVIIPSSL